MARSEQRASPDAGSRVNPVVDRLGAYSWRLIGMGIIAVAVFWLLAQLWVVVVALIVAVLFARALNPPAAWLRARGLRPGLVAGAVIIGFGLVIAGIVAALVPPIQSEFEDLGPTIEDAIDDIEDWLVEDSPFDVSRQDVREFREQADDRIGDALRSQSGAVIDTTLVVFEVVTALILALITSFFILKDGGRFGDWILGFVPEPRRSLVTRLASRAWWTLGGYLRGSATLGVIEGLIISVTVWLVGGSLAVPVGVITFFAAFVPFVGAIVAGAIAVLVTLVTAGTGGAVIVLIVAVAVQQFDNDLLAPLVFGRSLALHPLVVLFALAGGAALVGPAGALFAVPVAAVAVNVIAEAVKHNRDQEAVSRGGDTDSGDAADAREGAEPVDAPVEPPPDGADRVAPPDGPDRGRSRPPAAETEGRRARE